MLVLTLVMFGVFTFYWALDVYILQIKYHSILYPQAESSGDVQHVHLKGAPSTNGIPPQSFVVIYLQYVTGYTLVSIEARISYSFTHQHW